MTPTEVRDLRKRLSLTQRDLAVLLRLKNVRTVQRWEDEDKGYPPTGPALLLLRLLDSGLPPRRLQ